MAAPALETAPDELTVADGRVFVTVDPGRGLSVRDVLWNDTLVPITVTVARNAPEEATGIPYMATFAEVEVDTATGKVDILRLVVLHDAGTVMYASGAEGQQIGGQCTGIGESLYEEIVYDRASGVPLNFNFVDYGIPTMVDFPPVEPVLLEVWEGAGEYGACGIGEGAPAATPRAILNAIYNAIGVRIDDIPVKPEKVLAALAEAEAGRDRAAVLTAEIRAELAQAAQVAERCGVCDLAPEFQEAAAEASGGPQDPNAEVAP